MRYELSETVNRELRIVPAGHSEMLHKTSVIEFPCATEDTAFQSIFELCDASDQE